MSLSTSGQPDEAKLDEVPGADAQETTFTNVKPDELPEELQGIYKSLQGDYTRKTQEIAEQRRRAEQASTIYDAIQNRDPQVLRQIADTYGQETVLDALGYALDEDDPDPPANDFDALKREFEELKGNITQTQQKAQEEALLARIETDITKQFTGSDLSEKEREIVTAHALTAGYVTPEGFPDVRKAAEDFEEVLTGRQKKWAEGKRSPRKPVQGSPGSEQIDWSDEDARRAVIAAALEANSE